MRYERVIQQHFDVKSVSGDEFVCVCPWHSSTGTKPHLYINAVKGVFSCKACGKKGHLKNIMAEMPRPTGQDITDRLTRIAESKNVTPQRVYPETWLTRFDFPHRYWESRGFSEDVIRDFQLGYDPMMDRVTIPMRDEHGNLLGVVQRVLTNEQPRYRYPKGYPIGKSLFGSWMVGDNKKVALVEGTLDAVACWDARVPALAMLGSRLSADQRSLLLRLGITTVVIFTDDDKPGWEAIAQIHEALHGSGITQRVVKYRSYWSAKDPGELTPQQRRKAYHSATAWHRLE